MRICSKVVFVGLALGMVFLGSAAIAGGQDTQSIGRVTTLDLGFVEEVFVDYAAPTHAGPGPHPTEESDSFRLTQGGISWFSGSTVEYQISGAPSTAAETAVEDAVSTWDSVIGTREFARNDGTTQTNPCTPGVANTISWAPIDGAGGALASARVCRNVASKEIVGFRITFDSDDAWTTDPVSEPTKFDVENAGAHEFGHVGGLSHVNAPKDGCLTMYRFAGPGEVQKRTLGLGDQWGTNKLYGLPTYPTAVGCGS